MQPLENRTIRSLIGVCLLASTIVGCASWTDPSWQESSAAGDENPLAEVRENPRAVILEVEFVPIALRPDDPDQVASLWQWVDETSLDPEARAALAENGLRAGRLVREDRFRAKLDELRVAPDGVIDRFLTEAAVSSELARGGRRIPMRFGRRYELPLSKPLNGSHVTMVRLGGETIGKTLDGPQFLLAITPTTGDSPHEVRLRLRPEIQHGAMKQSFVASDSAIRIDTRRESWSLPALDTEFTAGQGETVVIAAATPALGLGQQMLTGSSADRHDEQLVVLINVARIPTVADRL